jgi:hypothetical protein
MENKIPTAEEFFGFVSGEIAYPPDFVHRKAIEFAKLHVESALKEAAKKAYFRDFNDNISYSEENKYSILNAYPLTNIK